PGARGDPQRRAWAARHVLRTAGGAGRPERFRALGRLNHWCARLDGHPGLGRRDVRAHSTKVPRGEGAAPGDAPAWRWRPRTDRLALSWAAGACFVGAAASSGYDGSSRRYAAVASSTARNAAGVGAAAESAVTRTCAARSVRNRLPAFEPFVTVAAYAGS